MTGTADGQKLRESLDNAQENGVFNIHERPKLLGRKYCFSILQSKEEKQTQISSNESIL
jgi:hypothetical protein